MTPVNATVVFEQSLPSHCTPTTHFLYRFSSHFGICVPTSLAFTSIALGNLSILSWLCAQLPQIWKNFQLKSTAGLSIFFLAEWLAGDATNLTGGLLTKQATWQVVLACYYVFVDLCLVFQYFWYTYFVPWWWSEGSVYSDGSDTDDDANSELINSLSPINSSFVEQNAETCKDDEEQPSKVNDNQPGRTPRLTDLRCEKDTLLFSTPTSSEKTKDFRLPDLSPRIVMYAATVSSLLVQAAAAPTGSQRQYSATETNLEIAGTLISWFSTLLYLGSRLPQLYKNWKRKSTTGLSPKMFMATFMGNSFYSASMLANPRLWYNYGPYGQHGWGDQDGSLRREYIISGAPFFLGAFGTLVQDATMGLQFLMYADKQEKLVKLRSRRGSVGRWRKVSGWMRGWIPSIKKERVVDLSESQRLLADGREADRRHSQYGGT